MHELFRISERVPVPAGQSPFHVRGRYYDRLLARMDREAGGRSALLAELQDDGVRQFLQQRFSWNGWYDVLPTMPVYAALARRTGKDVESIVAEGGRIAARDLVPRFFRFALQLVGPTVLAARVVQVVTHATDFVQVSLERFEDGKGRGRGAGIPLYVAPIMAGLVQGWFQGMLELGGATEVSARYTDVVKEGVREGFETVTIQFEFAWTPRR